LLRLVGQVGQVGMGQEALVDTGFMQGHTIDITLLQGIITAEGLESM
jgi:hypothetical protein